MEIITTKKRRVALLFCTISDLVNKFLIPHAGGATKRIGNLNSAFEKADRKKESARKKSVYICAQRPYKIATPPPAKT